MSALQADNDTDAFLVTKTASGIKIEFLKYPDFPLGAFLLEILVLNLALILSVVLIRWLLGPAMYCFALVFILAGLLSPFYLIWNYWAKDRLELTNDLLKINRQVSPFVHSRWQSYRRNEVKNLHVIAASEKIAAFEGIFGLRLIFIQNRGVIGFETPQGMLVRFGWGINEAEAEEVVAIIQQWIDKAES
jgi:hypothetical protein